MPIKDWSKYPSNWQEIRKVILTRAENLCEFCGASNGMPHPITGGKVVLTIAHLDHDTTHNEHANLRALCQKCHLNYDKELHKIHRVETLRKKELERTKNQMRLNF